MKEEAKKILEAFGFRELEKFLFVKGKKESADRVLLFDKTVMICTRQHTIRSEYQELEDKLKENGFKKGQA